MDRFWKWFESEEGRRKLRVAAVCLRLSLIAVRLSSQKAKRGDGPTPTLVLLNQGAVQDLTSEEFQGILPELANDPELDLTEAVDRLVATEGQICIRYD